MNFKLLRCTRIYLVLTIILGCSFNPIGAQGQSQDEFPLQDVITEIQTALKITQTDLNTLQLPKLKSVELTFESVVTKELKGKIKFLIFAFGKSVEKEQSQSVSFSLTPPKPKLPVAVAKRKGLSQQLVDVITSSARAMKEIELDSEPKLEFSGLKIELKFIVKKGTEGGAEFEISPVGLEFGANGSKSNVHSITVTYEK